MTGNLILRHNVVRFIREYLSERDFLEIETPILLKSTPEGARDFIVPSRLHPHKFYALPQSPQQLKQMLMVAGIERYFQIARCFRDEDLRADRQPEFTQLDLEMSFVDAADVRSLIEEMLVQLSASVSDKQIQQRPFPVITYADALDKYGVDRPDLRFGVELFDLTDVVAEQRIRRLQRRRSSRRTGQGVGLPRRRFAYPPRDRRHDRLREALRRQGPGLDRRHRRGRRKRPLWAGRSAQPDHQVPHPGRDCRHRRRQRRTRPAT